MTAIIHAISVSVTKQEKPEHKIEDVKSVYSGKNGRCCCGCSGNYRYPSSLTPEAFKKSHGYELDPKEVSDRQVRRIFGIVMGDPHREEGGSWVSSVVGERLYTVYFD